MARQTLPPFFIGTIDFLTFYKMHGRYFARKKSSLTAERVKTDACFIPTMQQADFLRRASKIGSVLYDLVPREHKQHQLYRTLTGQANLYLKKGLAEEEIVSRLLYHYIAPLKKKRVTEIIRKRKATRKKSNKAGLPPEVRRCRRFKLVEAIPGSLAPQGVLPAIVKEMIFHNRAAPGWLLPGLPGEMRGMAS